MMQNDMEKLREEFLRSAEARYIHRLHGVLLVLRGLSTVKAGKLLGDPQRTIAHWVIRFRERGLKGLSEEKFGPPEILNSAQKRALMKALAKSPKDSGLTGDAWKGALVTEFIRNKYAIKLSPRHSSRLLAAFKKQTKA